ncbi:MAG: PEP-CTERM sorting domain-containing protein [Deltaproteobacteria bacterium]|nr:PEP-CTERM sorting domain-containing protein [Deltaproteobacteria bacterium]
MYSVGWRVIIAAGLFIAVMAGGPGTARAASYYGLQTGDVVQSLTYDSSLTGVSYNSTTGVLTATGFATSLLVAVPTTKILTEINGGMFVFDMDFVSESITPLGGTLYNYSATFAGVAGTTDIRLYAPNCPGAGCGAGIGTADPESDGYDAEQDGRLMLSGDFGATPITLSSTIDTSLSAQTFSLTGLFTTTGGDAQFIQAYGPSGSLSFVSGGIDNFAPSLVPGLLNPPGDTQVFDSSFTAHVTGSVIPLGASAFQPIPEPSSMALLGLGLGWLARRRLRRK